MEEQLRERARIEVLPRYPNGARRKRIQGFVVAEVEFDREGTVKHVEIVESTHPLFVAPTVTALKQWRFNPVVTPKREMLGGKGKLTFYFYYKNSRGWSEYPSIFRRKLNPAKS
jgi:TonB family protein